MDLELVRHEDARGCLAMLVGIGIAIPVLQRRPRSDECRTLGRIVPGQQAFGGNVREARIAEPRIAVIEGQLDRLDQRVQVLLAAMAHPGDAGGIEDVERH